MTITELHALIGRRGWLQVNDMEFEIVIRDVKQAYGCTRLRVRPVAGDGETWVDAIRVALKPREAA